MSEFVARATEALTIHMLSFEQTMLNSPGRELNDALLCVNSSKGTISHGTLAITCILSSVVI